MSNTITWYFDFISPFSYLQQARFRHFPKEIVVLAKPVLFAGLLNHWEHKGPAEIPTKRIFSYQHVVWLGKKHGTPLRMPPAHPFNPLRALRLAIVLKNDLSAISRIFNYIWRDGLSVDDDASWFELAATLGVLEPDVLTSQTEVKQQLRQNTEAAIESGVFGVPSIIADGHLFWGFDATDMYLDYQGNPNFYADLDLLSIADIPESAIRKQKIEPAR
jgi:2-hydroxychromene-2-carboxylate isomerase